MDGCALIAKFGRTFIDRYLGIGVQIGGLHVVVFVQVSVGPTERAGEREVMKFDKRCDAFEVEATRRDEEGLADGYCEEACRNGVQISLCG